MDQPTAARGAAADAGGLVMPSVPAEALDVAIDTAVGAQAAKLAPKMTMEGQPLRATLKEGERANLLVTMAPGKCYTFVAFSPPGQVAQVDLKLMAPPFYNVEAAKSGAADKNPAVIGKGSAPQCPVSPIAVPYRIDANSGVGTQVVTGDLNGDELPDIVVANKQGTFVFTHQTRDVDRTTWEAEQPTPTLQRDSAAATKPAPFRSADLATSATGVVRSSTDDSGRGGVSF